MFGESTDSPTSAIIFMLLGLIYTCIVVVFVITLNGFYASAELRTFQKGVREATLAYSQQYNYSFSALKSLSEGYLVKEDIEYYKTESNPIHLDTKKASDYFFHVLSGNTDFNVKQLHNMKLNLVEVTTTFDKQGAPSYIYTVYRDVNQPIAQNIEVRDLGSLQRGIENCLGVKLDINGDFDRSFRKAVQYDSNETVKGRKIFGTYTTFMVIGKNIPIQGLINKNKYDFCEIQTYSITRHDKGGGYLE
ncbi:MAG: hypothetical protein E7H54_04565 [Clostridium perfringens]|nr:hypothetical protein [Clostridium perfringens]